MVRLGSRGWSPWKAREKRAVEDGRGKASPGRPVQLLRGLPAALARPGLAPSRGEGLASEALPIAPPLDRQAPLFPAGRAAAKRPRMADTISWDDFERVDIRVGTVIRAEPYPEARRPAIKLWVDFGAGIGVRKTSAQLTVHYTPEALLGRQVAAVVNFPPRQIGKFMSEILVLGMPDAEGAVVLLAPDQLVPNGGKMF